MVKNLPALQDTQVQSLGQEDPLEKEMATHSSSLAWKNPWTEEPDGLQSMGSQRVGCDWAIDMNEKLFYNVVLISAQQLSRLYVYIYLPSLLDVPSPNPYPTPLGHHRASSWPSLCYITVSVYMSILLFQFAPSSPSPPVSTSLFPSSESQKLHIRFW